MIKSIYETHLHVSNLRDAISFYQKLKLQLAYVLEERKVAFFYVGENRQMLGLWEVEQGKEVKKNHFAFGVAREDITGAIDWLRQLGIEPQKSFGKEPLEPIVHTWMPAASVYFQDLMGIP